MNFDYDLLVIGGGPGGYTAAIRGAQLGLNTALAEKDQLGGTCLNRGCIPAKTLISASEYFAALEKGAIYGISAEKLSFDLAKTVKYKNDTVSRLRNGINFLLRKNGVKLLRGEAVFIDEHTVEIKGKPVTANKFIIATGSEPRPLPCPSQSTKIVDSTGILNITQLPQSLIIVGGGVIGLEFASAFLALGSQVTIVEKLENILGQMEEEISQKLQECLEKQGLKLLTGIDVKEIFGDDKATVICQDSQGEEFSLEADLVLNSVGRKAYWEGLNPEKAGVKTDHKGIIVNSQFSTNQEHIMAIGDVIGGAQLAHLAAAQGICAAEIAAGINPEVNLKVIPQCLYTRPQAASVGLTSKEAKSQGISYQEAVFPLSACGKALAMGEEEGLVKLIFNEEKLILGVHILAPHATDIIGEAAVTLANEMGLEAIAKAIHPHPTIAEMLMEAAHLGQGKPINIVKP